MVDAGDDTQQETVGNLIVIGVTLGIAMGSLVQIPLSSLAPNDPNPGVTDAL